MDANWKRILRTGTGKGVRIGLLDTGAHGDHPDLAGSVIGHFEIGASGNIVRVEDGRDWNEHGTACAGILHQVAPDAEIYSVQVVGDAPNGKPSDLISGFRFAIESGWDVINISAGAGKPHRELRELADEAWEAGIIVVAAKDNRLGVIGFPAAFPTVIAVDMEYYPDPLALRYDPASPVEVEANGIYIEAPCAEGGRRVYTGSSFAAPLISGIAGRLKSACLELDPMTFRGALADLSEPDSRCRGV